MEYYKSIQQPQTNMKINDLHPKIKELLDPVDVEYYEKNKSMVDLSQSMLQCTAEQYDDLGWIQPTKVHSLIQACNKTYVMNLHTHNYYLINDIQGLCEVEKLNCKSVVEMSDLIEETFGVDFLKEMNDVDKLHDLCEGVYNYSYASDMFTISLPDNVFLQINPNQGTYCYASMTNEKYKMGDNTPYEEVEDIPEFRRFTFKVI